VQEVLAMDWINGDFGFYIQQGQELYLCHIIKNISVADLTSFPSGTRGFFPGVE
jgi:hypothetical protein